MLYLSMYLACMVLTCVFLMGMRLNRVVRDLKANEEPVELDEDDYIWLVIYIVGWPLTAIYGLGALCVSGIEWLDKKVINYARSRG